jgi:hypothetical protein
MARKLYERYLGTGAHADGDSVVLETGDTSVVSAIEFPHEAEIKKLVVVSTVGTPGTFTVDLFNCSDLIGEDNEAVAKVLASNSSSGGAVSIFTANSGYPFRNMEGSQSVPVRRIYLRISVVEALEEDCSFEVAIAGEPQMGA